MGGHPVVIEAACAAARAMGAGAGGTRNIGGTSPAHDALETELAAMHGKQAALLFTSGFVSNQAALSTVLNSRPTGAEELWQVFSDAKNHASMIAGIKSARSVCHVFRHNDMADLEALLCAAPPGAPKLIAFESVYSMDADIAPLGAICDLAARHGALTYLDEVHGLRRMVRPAPAWPSATAWRTASTSSRARLPRPSAATAGWHRRRCRGGGLCPFGGAVYLHHLAAADGGGRGVGRGGDVRADLARRARLFERRRR